MKFRLLALSIVYVTATVSTLTGQGVTGQIVGKVFDASGSAVVGAAVRLSSDLTQQERSFPTDSTGSFTFTNLVPGDYSLQVAVPGFKAYSQKAIQVSSEERVDLHEIQLSVGEATTTV